MEISLIIGFQFRFIILLDFIFIHIKRFLKNDHFIINISRYKFIYLFINFEYFKKLVNIYDFPDKKLKKHKKKHQFSVV